MLTRTSDENNSQQSDGNRGWVVKASSLQWFLMDFPQLHYQKQQEITVFWKIDNTKCSGGIVKAYNNQLTVGGFQTNELVTVDLYLQ